MSKLNSKVLLTSSIMFLGTYAGAMAADNNGMEATKYTKQEIQKSISNLNFSDKQDFKDAQRGFIATWPTNQIKDESGKVIWDFSKWDFLGKPGITPAPASVNPSLWRVSQLNSIHGLFEVEKGLYQVRGFDLSNITFMRGDKGWIVIDTCTSAEIAKAAYKLLCDNVEDLPITNIIVTHSHGDHFGGLQGLASQEDIDSGKVHFYAPEGFYEHSISENLSAGNAMNRRLSYQYGNLLDSGDKGTVGAGLAQTLSTGEVTILKPSNVVHKTGEVHKIDGVEFDFLMAPGTEAPSEMLFYTPKYKALCAAEDITHTMHNISTLRGATPRKADKWSAAIDEAHKMWGDKAEIMYSPHHWPTWGSENISTMMENERDMYKYINDQTLRLANMGYTPNEIAKVIKLPKELDSKFYNRGYYGSLSHNVKATYDRYFSGWWDGNPANLNPLAPVEQSQKYVEYMGGVENVMKHAKADYANGEYRWVVTAMNNVVFTDPSNQEAKNLEADAMTQLAYQTENGTWRNYYLAGANDLRHGINKDLPTPTTLSEAMIGSLPANDFFNYLATHVVPSKAVGKDITINVDFTDVHEKYSLSLENSVLNSRTGYVKDADVTVKMDRATLNNIISKSTTLDKEISSGNVSVKNMKELKEFLGTMDNPEFWFNIVSPNGTMKVADQYKF